jgi:hypothetical protein
VLYELRGERYHVRVEQPPALTHEDLEDLTRRANGTRLSDLASVSLPPHPVRAGDSWPIDPQVFTRCLGTDAEVDLRQSHAYATLLRIYPKGDKKYGVIRATLFLALVRMGTTRFSRVPAQYQINVTADQAIDGSEAARTVATDGTCTATLPDAVDGGGPRVGLMLNTSAREVRFADQEQPELTEVMGRARLEPAGAWCHFSTPVGFSVRLPGAPRVTDEHDPDTAAIGRRFAVESDHGPPFTYAVSYTDRLDLASGGTPDNLLDSLADRKITGVKKKDKIAWAGYPGLEVLANGRERDLPMTVTYRLYLVERRVYFLVVAHPKGKEDSAALRRFFDSFTLQPSE